MLLRHRILQVMAASLFVFVLVVGALSPQADSAFAATSSSHSTAATSSSLSPHQTTSGGIPDVQVTLPPGTHPCPTVPGKVPTPMAACSSAKPPTPAIPASSRCPAVKGKYPSSARTVCTVKQQKTGSAGPVTAQLPAGAVACPSTATKKSSPTASCSSRATGGPTTTYTISLAVDTDALAPGASATLTATANVDVGPTPYYIEIFDQTAQTLVGSCGTGSTCSTSVSESSPTTEVFIAFISDDSTSYPPGSIQATSNTVSVTWLSISLSADTTTPATGSPVNLTATVNTDVGPTPYYIEIFDQSNGNFLVDCAQGSTCTTSYTENSANSDTFVAYVSGYGTSNPPPSVQVTSNTVTVSWQENWSISLSAYPVTLQEGKPTILTATTNNDVGPTPYYIELFNLSRKKLLAICGGGITCEISASLSAVRSQTFIAFVSDDSTLYPPSNIQATSNTVSVTWQPAQDILPYPSWWKGVCDNTDYSAGNPNHIASFTLPRNAITPSSYRGVVACGPRRDGDNGPDVTVHFFSGAYPVLEWECVELSMRYMYLAYGVVPYSANGDEVVNNYLSSANANNYVLRPINNNGSTHIAPQPGDILSYNTSLAGGHTSVVTASKVNSQGNGSISILQQNFTANGVATLSVSGWVVGGGVTGWLHHYVDVSPQSGGATTRVTITGSNFTPNGTVTVTFGKTSMPSVTADSAGTISTTITVPASQQPGQVSLSLTDVATGHVSTTVFYVQSNWYLFGHDLARTRFNSHETRVKVSNVSQLTQDWTYTATREVESSPIVVRGVVYVGADDGNLYALRADTGSLIWSFATDGIVVRSTPTVAYNLVYVTSGNGTLYAINTDTGQMLWRSSTSDYSDNSPAVANGIVYVGSEGTGQLAAFNAAGCGSGVTSCSPVWVGEANAGAFLTDPSVANGMVYVGGNDGTLSAFESGGCGGPTTCFPIWTASAGAAINGTPTVDTANGLVYVTSWNNTSVSAFDAFTGNLVWTVNTGTYSDSSPAVDTVNGIVYVSANFPNTLYAFNANSGSLLWSYTGSTGIESFEPSPAVANGVVYIAYDNDNVYAFNAAGCGSSTCSPIWTVATGEPIHSSPTINDGVVYIGSDDYKLYAFHLPNTTP